MSRQNHDEYRKTDGTLKKKHVVCSVSEERGGKRTRKGDKSGMGRLERMKRGSGIKK
jgi:hypothetical protein